MGGAAGGGFGGGAVGGGAGCWGWCVLERVCVVEEVLAADAVGPAADFGVCQPAVFAGPVVAEAALSWEGRVALEVFLGDGHVA